MKPLFIEQHHVGTRLFRFDQFECFLILDL